MKILAVVQLVHVPIVNVQIANVLIKQLQMNKNRTVL